MTCECLQQLYPDCYYIPGETVIKHHTIVITVQIIKNHRTKRERKKLRILNFLTILFLDSVANES